MLTLIILAPIFLVLFILTRILRLLFFPFHRHHHHGWNRFGNGWNGAAGWGRNQYGCNPGRYGRRGLAGGGLGTVLLLFALDRLFGRRW